MHFVLELS